MKISHSVLLSLSFILFISFPVFAQKAPMKFGKIDPSELEMTVYENDSSASAVVLCDYGFSMIDYGSDQFQVKYTRHVRIKILNKDGYQWADHSVKLYKRSGDKETISGLKGYSYNLEDGKLIKTKLEKKSIFNEEIDDNWDKVSFTMPAVKEQSVIEFTYTVTSDYLFNYQGWQFQYSIPVKWSEYRAKFIEYYTFKNDFQGYISPFIYDTKKGEQSFTVKTESKISAGMGGGRTSGSTNSYSASFTQHRWVLKEVPAFIEEPYLTTVSDYISRIDFELQSTKFPGGMLKIYRGTWDKVNDEMLTNNYLGDKTKGALFLNKEVAALITEDNTEEERIDKVYHFIKDKLTWNGNYGKYAFSNPKLTFDKKEGSAAEINLMLVNMLKKADIEADPVLVSTRGHGMVKEFQAVSSQFNYVICRAKLGESYILLDATEKQLPIGVLPERCLNGRGYTVSKDSPGWVSLNSNTKRSSKLSGSFDIDTDGMLTGQIKNSYSGYSALQKRKSYLKNGEEDFIESLVDNSDWEISEVEIENSKDLKKPFVIKFEAEVSSSGEALANMIYLNPMVNGQLTKNPFKLESREYPVSFPSLIIETCYFIFTIPDGYTVEELPKSVNMQLPNGAGSLKYVTAAQGNKITVMSKFSINKDMFVPSEYPYIKSFYAQVVSKHKEQIVLKKS